MESPGTANKSNSKDFYSNFFSIFFEYINTVTNLRSKKYQLCLFHGD